MFSHTPVRKIKNLDTHQQKQLDDQLKKFLQLKQPTKKDVMFAMDLVEKGADLSMDKDALLEKLMKLADAEYQRDEICGSNGFKYYPDNIQRYHDTCKQDPAHSFIINSIINLVQSGADPDKTIDIRNVNGKFYSLSPLVLVLDYKPEATEILLKANAKPYIAPTIHQFSYQALLSRALTAWLFNLETISSELVDILKYYKKYINFTSLTTVENFVYVLNPATPVGQIVWARTGAEECSLSAGTCKSLVKHLGELNISKPIIVAQLAKAGIILDSRGYLKNKPILKNAKMENPLPLNGNKHLDDELEFIIIKDEPEIKDLVHAMQLVKQGANSRMKEEKLLLKFLAAAHRQYKRNDIYSDSKNDLALYEKNIEMYKIECRKNPEHSFIIDSIIKLIELGSNPNQKAYVLNGNTLQQHCITSLGLILDYKPEAAAKLMLAGASPGQLLDKNTSFIDIIGNYPSHPFINYSLTKWLFNVKSITSKIVNVLKNYKNHLDFESFTTKENFLMVLNPLTPVGKVVWAKRGENECSLFGKTRLMIVEHLQKQYGISRTTIIDHLEKCGIIIDRVTGVFTKILDATGYIHDAVTQGDTEMLSMLLEHGAIPDEKSINKINNSFKALRAGEVFPKLSELPSKIREDMFLKLITYGAAPFYYPSHFKNDSINLVIELQPYLNQAQKLYSPRDMIELTRALLQVYIDDTSLTANHKHIPEAKKFLERIEKSNCTFEDIKKEAKELTNKSSILDKSKTLKGIFKLIGKKEFEYFLLPMMKASPNNKETKIETKKDTFQFFNTTPVRAIKNLAPLEQKKLDKQLKAVLDIEPPKEIEDFKRAMELARQGANISMERNLLLNILVTKAFFEYDKNKLESFREYNAHLKNIKDYFEECEKNPDHSFYIDSIVELINLGADPNRKSHWVNGIVKEYCVTPLGLILDFKPEAAAMLIEAGALPFTRRRGVKGIENTTIYDVMRFSNNLDLPYHPFIEIALVKWLLTVKNISQTIVDVLKNYRDELDFISCLTRENYLHVLNPLTSIGRVLWADRSGECTFFNGKRADVINYLDHYFNIKYDTIISEFAKMGIMFEKNTGKWLQYQQSTNGLLAMKVNKPNETIESFRSSL